MTCHFFMEHGEGVGGMQSGCVMLSCSVTRYEAVGRILLCVLMCVCGDVC